MSFAPEEIEALFQETQEVYLRAAIREAIRGGLNVRGQNPDRRPPKSPARKAYNRAFTAKRKHEEIRQRLLAGERPKQGRKPVRWWRVANELGIDIGQPNPPTNHCNTDPPAPEVDLSRSTQ